MVTSAARERLVSQYRREVRRCRGQGDVGEVHAGLRELNRRLDEATRPRAGVVAEVGPGDRYERFARAVAGCLEAGLLRYSNRKRLLEQAAGLGIAAFDANLLIAAVQHAARNGQAAEVEPKPARPVWPYWVAGGVQVLLLLVAWWMLG